MLDLDAVREAYFRKTPHRPDDHIPTREEQFAAYERGMVAAYVAAGDDPAEHGIGEHGSLIGGPDKPLRIIRGSIDAAEMVRASPMPLAWFEHGKRPEKCLETQEEERALAYLNFLSGKHLAGVPDRPSGLDFHRMLRADSLSRDERFYMEEMFSRMWIFQFVSLLANVKVSIYDIARAVTNCGCRRGEVVTWLNQFAMKPR